ncbi:MAG TPA: ribonuclease domain-containing protein [Mycobacteriales bacterium]
MVGIRRPLLALIVLAALLGGGYLVESARGGSGDPHPRTVAATGLPGQAQATIALVERGGPYPFSRDGVVFDNREHLLPAEPTGYYREYTVITPGESDRGPRRIIHGRGGQFYYTANHYVSFVHVDPDR